MKFIHDQQRVAGYRFKERTTYTDHHLGTDWESDYIPLYAPCDGKVVSSPYGEEGGQWIYFEEVGTFACQYFGVERLLHRFAHLSSVNMIGHYNEGEVIGVSGNSGSLSTGAHTHHDISKNYLQLNNIDNFIDPEIYFNLQIMKAPQWFIDEGHYDRAIEAGIEWVKEDRPVTSWELLASQFKVRDKEEGKKKA